VLVLEYSASLCGCGSMCAREDAADVECGRGGIAHKEEGSEL
jgi:hypothetical protein